MSEPYVPASPGALITADNINLMQSLIRDDIAKTTKKAIDDIQKVPSADNAGQLEGTSKSDLIKQIVALAVAEIRAKSGYMQIFKVLKVGKEKLVKHDLHLCPLVDLYQLDYFLVLCSEDDQKSYPAWTTFYLHHSGEKRLRLESGKFLEIHPGEGQGFHLSLPDLLSRYNVKYSDDSSLSDVENDFWEAFFKAPNDEFDDNQYCHSPWFQKCCREEKTVRDAKRNGDWDNLWVQFRPRKTVNYPLPERSDSLGNVNLPTGSPTPAPTEIQVIQYDQDTIGLTLLANPVTQPEPLAKEPNVNPVGPDHFLDAIPDFKTELKLMVLLKV